MFAAPPPKLSAALSEKPQFIPPESFGNLEASEDDSLGVGMEYSSAWDVATRYHEFKAKRSSDRLRKHLRELSAEAILARAQEVLGSVVHPTVAGSGPWPEVPARAEQVDFDLDETLENSPLAVYSVAYKGGDPSDSGGFGDSGGLLDFGTFVGSEGLSADFPLTEQDIWMSYSTHRHQPIILSVDTSLSMTGEKLALTAVALAVVLLEFPDDPIGIVAFENEAKILKHPEERLSIQLFVERFLDVPAQGYTHLEDGMKAGLKLVQRTKGGQGRPPSMVLLTDGKYTAGKDPSYLAPRFPHLVVLKMGKERASHALCKELAQKGHGVLREVDELEALPGVMYSVVKDLLRGRSLV